MNVLITGNMGYIGPVVVRHLRRTIPDVRIYGYDKGFFGHCLTDAAVLPENDCDVQYSGDVRVFPDEILKQVDAVVMLAAISNDPMGASFEQVTDQINHLACADIARRAVARGVKRVVFASSCSMYGYAEGGARKETDELNPLTAYAHSKVATERALAALDPGNAILTSLRFSTACGMSPRLRLDLVLNDFVACAIASQEITVLSDGTPWRPLIDVKDMARSIEWALTRDPTEAGDTWPSTWGRTAGTTRCAIWRRRSRPRCLAPRSASTPRRLPTSAPIASILSSTADRAQPSTPSVAAAVDRRLKLGMEQMGFNDPNFRSSQFMRLKVLERLSTAAA